MGTPWNKAERFTSSESATDSPQSTFNPNYGGDFPWVDTHYKMKVHSGVSPLQWLNFLTKRMLVLEDIAFTADGTFHRPTDGTSMFPARGIDLRWRHDLEMDTIIIDFYRVQDEDGQDQESARIKWRWDELKAKPRDGYASDPSEVPDLMGIGHVGKFTFTYDLVRSTGMSIVPDTPSSSTNADRLQTLIMSIEPVTRKGQKFPYWNDAMKQERSRSGYDCMGPLFASPPYEARLGEGTFGVVWLARNRKTGDLYAVKNMVARKGNHDSSCSVAQNEFDVISKILEQPHQSIVSFVALESFRISRGELYMLVMEFCSGGDLQDALDARAKNFAKLKMQYAPAQESMQWIGEIFQAVEHIHTKLNLLIRDLKPRNVMLNHNKRAKLTDFGCGRMVAESAGGDWTFAFPPGSPGYVAPELLAQESYSYPVDIYSLGALIWVVLSGGCKKRSSPGPPMYITDKPHLNRDFSVYRYDWKILQDYLKDQRRARCPISDVASEVISRMVQENPAKRPDCEQVRNSNFFKSAVIPVVEALEQEQGTQDAVVATSFSFGSGERSPSHKTRDEAAELPAPEGTPAPAAESPKSTDPGVKSTHKQVTELLEEECGRHESHAKKGLQECGPHNPQDSLTEASPPDCGIEECNLQKALDRSITA
jgi:serine/threonine protein kinase